MPCRVEMCPKCDQYDCAGFNPGAQCAYNGKKPSTTSSKGFDVEGALCDVLTLLEDKHVMAFYDLDVKTVDWWRDHEDKEAERIKQEALKKLSPRERRALGLK